ncbi:MAG: GNAT family N-acetyltransferase [Clostridia bacterium]|nr:GNAT family N-acetyltransferase [Clostridia bacterium]
MKCLCKKQHPEDEKLDFLPYSYENLIKMSPWIKKSPYLCNDISIGSIFMWNEGADLRFCVYNDTFILRQEINDQCAFTYPYGKDPEGMIELLKDYTERHSMPLRFFAVDEDLVNMIKNDPRLQPVSADFDMRWSDYLYDFAAAAEVSGKKFNGQRNHINKFTKNYGEPNVSLIEPEDVENIETLIDEYEAEHPGGNMIEHIEIERTKKIVRRFKELGLLGACLKVNGEIAAFSIGEIIGKTLLIHDEKALKKYEGAYPTMYRSFVRLVRDNIDGNLIYVNREDDSGDPGIRISKNQYHPVKRVHKYIVHIGSPAARLEEDPIIRSEHLVLTKFRETDKKAYLAMNLDDENNRYWGYDYRKDITITGKIDEDTFYDAAMYDMRIGDSINFAVRQTEDGDMIGEVILWHFTRDGKAEIGCRLMPEYHGKGMGREAFAAAVKYSNEKLGLVLRARCHVLNLASHHMITSAGLEKAARVDDCFYFTQREESGREGEICCNMCET